MLSLNEIMHVTPTRELISPTLGAEDLILCRDAVPHRLLRYRIELWQKQNWDWLWAEYKAWYEEYIDDKQDENIVQFHSFCKISFLNLSYNLERDRIVENEIREMTEDCAAR